MNGIERLRKVAGLFHGPTMSSALANDLNAIADQIEREHAEECFKMGERAAEDVEAVAWVRERGGVEHVRQQWAYLSGRANHADHVDRQLAKRQRQIDESHAALRRKNACIAELESTIDVRERANEQLNDELNAMRPRLMPEGMEWPMFEDGAPVRIGDTAQFGDDVMEIVGVELNHFGYVLHGSINDGMRECVDGDEYGVAVKRPAPKVLDADGAEIRVGDTVWTTRDLDKFTVTNPNNGKFLSVSCKGEDGEDYCCYPTDLTHRAPVLAADGRPLREGETVWLTGGSERHVVLSTEKDAIGNIVTEIQAPGLVRMHISPSRLTHERPESKCRDCAHWQKDPTADKMGVCWFYYHEHEGMDCYAARLGDIGACEEFVPRGKALAGDA